MDIPDRKLAQIIRHTENAFLSAALGHSVDAWSQLRAAIEVLNDYRPERVFHLDDDYSHAPDAVCDHCEVAS